MFQGITGKKKFCPIGQVLPGVHVIILNDQLELQPVGKSGEVRINPFSTGTVSVHKNLMPLDIRF